MNTRDKLLARLGLYQQVRMAGEIDRAAPALIPIEEVLAWLDEDEADNAVKKALPPDLLPEVPTQSGPIPPEPPEVHIERQWP